MAEPVGMGLLEMESCQSALLTTQLVGMATQCPGRAGLELLGPESFLEEPVAVVFLAVAPVKSDCLTAELAEMVLLSSARTPL